MDAVSSFIDNLASKAKQEMSDPEFEYIGSDGFIHCSKCGSAKQTKISVPNLDIYDKVVYCMCKCMEKATREAQVMQALREQEENKEFRRDQAFKFERMKNMTFKHDAHSDTTVSDMCRKWASRFKEGKIRKWLFLQGISGSGKTFYSSCIANELIDAGFTVKVTNVLDIEADFWQCKDRTAFYRKYNSYALLVFDDFTADIPNESTVTVIHKIISDRILDGKCCLFNSADDDMKIAEIINRKTLASRLINKIWSMVYALECEPKAVR